MSQNSQAPSLSIFAGSMSGKGSVDGPQRIASFLFPSGVAADAKGNIYVADSGQYEEANHTIRKISADGTVTTFAGKAGESGHADGLGAEARFFRPEGLATDTQGNVYVADKGNNLIRKISPDGVVSTLAGSGQYGNEDGIGSEASFFGPNSVAVDAQGNVYADSAYRIRKISPAGVVSTLAGGRQDYPGKDGKGSEATFSSIARLAVDREGNVYTTDFSSVRKISPDGVVTTIAGNAIADGGEGCEPRQAQFKSVSSITVDTEGNIFVLDSHAIRKISHDGKVTTLAGLAGVAGNVDGRGAAARFNGPYAELTNDTAGNIYLADTQNHSIRKITPEGVVTTVAGHAWVGTRSDSDDEPKLRTNERSRIAIDLVGNVYVSNNRTIYKITPDGVITDLELGLSTSNFKNIGAMFAAPNGELYFLNEGFTLRGNTSGGGGYSLVPKSVSAFFKWFEPSEFNSIYQLAADGKLKEVAGKSADVSVGGIVKNSDGEVIFSGHKTLNKLKTQLLFSTKALPFVGQSNERAIQNEATQLGVVSSLAIDAADNIYAADIGGGVIRKISPTGAVSVLAGSGQAGPTNGKGKLASFDRPISVAADKKGNIYVLELNSDVVRKVTADGEVTTLVGTAGEQGFVGGPLPGVISRPLALGVHNTSLYILMEGGLVAVVKNLP